MCLLQVRPALVGESLFDGSDLWKSDDLQELVEAQEVAHHRNGATMYPHRRERIPDCPTGGEKGGEGEDHETKSSLLKLFQ